MITAQVVLLNPEGFVLGVSRKNNHADFGLPGGKMDPEDNNDPMVTAIRECKEETGLDITNLRLIFAIHKNNNMGYTYLADYSGEINHNEPHVVKWVPFQVLINGSFGRYNELVSESLFSMGVDFRLDIDEETLKRELEIFMLDNTFNGIYVNLKELVKEKNWLGKSQYTLYLTNVVFETCDIDSRFSDGVQNIGDKYGVKIFLPSDYYSK